MSWYWDLQRKKAQMQQEGRNMAMNLFNKGRAKDSLNAVRGLLGNAPQEAVIAEGFGGRDRLYEQGITDNPITGRRPDDSGSGSISDRLYTPLQSAQAGTGFRGSDMGRDAQTDLLGGLMTKGGLDANQASGLLSTQLGPQATSQDPITPYQRAQQETAFRNKRDADNAKYRTVRTAADDMVNTLGLTDNPMAEKAAITQFVKIGDPTSIVSTNEAGQVSGSGGIFDQIEGLSEAIFGKGEITDTMRRQMAEYGNSLVEGQRKEILRANEALDLTGQKLGYKATRSGLTNYEPLNISDNLKTPRMMGFPMGTKRLGDGTFLLPDGRRVARKGR